MTQAIERNWINWQGLLSAFNERAIKRTPQNRKITEFLSRKKVALHNFSNFLHYKKK